MTHTSPAVRPTPAGPAAVLGFRGPLVFLAALAGALPEPGGVEITVAGVGLEGSGYAYFPDGAPERTSADGRSYRFDEPLGGARYTWSGNNDIF
ncbi:hypothetical protein OG871_26750 [Kitasatospora sp. NBC_00374]|uniref:hypothetical protein n=1 Tax=Kitasatospora sp. NBC_00374 TaxID=2975964 RepID=UPI0030E25BD1